METVERLNFIHEIRERAKMPWTPFNWAFWGYLAGIIIGIGGLGIWFSIPSQNISIIVSGISTYSIALLASSFIDLNLIPDTENKIAMLIYSVIFLGIGITLFFFSITIKSDKSLIPAGLGFLFSILTWYLAYADSDRFDEDAYNEKIRQEAKQIHGKGWDAPNQTN
jgi:hypothetical protein